MSFSRWGVIQIYLPLPSPLGLTAIRRGFELHECHLVDDVVQLLPDIMSQSIYAVFTRAFPLSLHRFDDDFKQYLIDTVHEWTNGMFWRLSSA